MTEKDKTRLKMVRIHVLVNYVALAVIVGDMEPFGTFDDMWPTIKKDLQNMTKII